jgi:hypothetical protein
LAGDILLDLERVDDAGVPQHDLHLAVEELNVLHLGHGAVGAGSVAHQAVDDAALEQVLLADLVNVLDVDVLIEHAVRVYEDDRAHRAGSQTAGLDDLRVLGDPHVGEFLAERGTHFKRARGDTPAPCAHEHLVADLFHICSFVLR